VDRRPDRFQQPVRPGNCDVSVVVKVLIQEILYSLFCLLSSTWSINFMKFVRDWIAKAAKGVKDAKGADSSLLCFRGW